MEYRAFQQKLLNGFETEGCGLPGIRPDGQVPFHQKMVYEFPHVRYNYNYIKIFKYSTGPRRVWDIGAAPHGGLQHEFKTIAN